jgi:plasmid stabilization system protein ParE
VTRLPFHPDARTEFREAVAWHERERSGFGALLIDAVTDKVGQAARFPRSGRPVSGFDEGYDVRQFTVRRFRYVVLITGKDKPFRTVLSAADYAEVRSLGREFFSRTPRSIER